MEILNHIINIIKEFTVWLFHGYHELLLSFIVCMVLDYITGITVSVLKSTVNSKTGLKGILKKVLYMVVIALCGIIDRSLKLGEALQGVCIIFFIVNEGISILENVSEFINVPEQLKGILKKYNEKGDDKK